jgi:hypothetical protein
MIPRFIHGALRGSVAGALLVALACGNSSSEGGPSGSASTGSSSGAVGISTGGTGAATTGKGSGTGTTGSGATEGSAMGTSSTGSGSGGTASSTSSTTSSGVTTGSNSVLQRGNDLMRRETFLQPTLTKTVAATMTMDNTFTAAAKFNGGMAASVLYFEDGPPGAGCPAAASGCKATTRAAGNGIFLAATSGNTVYALDETSGAIVWSKALVGTGGDGIRGTPVVDPVTRALYVVSCGGGSHYVHALSTDDGTERTGWPVKLTMANLTINGTAFNSVDQNQHGALMFLSGIVYVPFGGHIGDGGNYRGWVVAIQASDPTKVGGWVTAGTSEGIWAHGGSMASDGTNIYVVTSNGHASDHTKPTTDSEEVVKFTGMGAFTRNPQNVYYPTNWQYMDSSDKDFGSSSPAYVPLPAGSTPSALIVAPAKPGAVYFLDANNLSSGKYPQAGGELQEITVASTTTESVYAAPTIYSSASGLHAAIDVGIAAVCPAGGPQGDKMIVSMLIQPGKTPFAKTVWCSSASGNGGTAYNQPPISTTTDANGGNAIVWYTNGGGLMGVDGDTGETVVKAAGECTSMEKMMWPIVVKGRIIVGADGHLCAWSHP